MLLVECLLSLAPQRDRSPATDVPRPQVCIVIPAHDEEKGIERTIHTLRRQLESGDRILVVADNCTDRTAALARAAGADVIERREPDRRGKGYALAFGIRHLSAEPPEVLVFVDADCEVSGGAITTLAALARRTGRPVQAAYLMRLPKAYGMRDLVSNLAFTIKNLVRPTGLARLGLPCHLTGTGMACPWELVDDVDLATGEIVEDMWLGLQWALAGKSPIFCEQARVRSVLPQREDAARSQRTRWEHGHIQMLLAYAPQLIVEGLRQRRLDLIALGLDLAIPPLSLLVLILLLGETIAATVTFLGSSSTAAWLFGIELLMIATGVLVGWWRSGRDQLPFRSLLAVPIYLLWKLPIYFAFLSRRQEQWRRTPRDL